MQNIMLVSKQIVSCKNNAPLISIVQDSLVGCYMLTHRDQFVNKQDFQKYMMFLEYPDNEYKPKYTTPYKSESDSAYEIHEGRSSSMTISNTEDHNEYDEVYGKADNRKQRICVTTP